MYRLSFGESRCSYIVMSILELILICGYVGEALASCPSHSDVDASLAFAWLAVPFTAPLLFGLILKLGRLLKLFKSTGECAAQEQTISNNERC